MRGESSRRHSAIGLVGSAVPGRDLAGQAYHHGWTLEIGTSGPWTASEYWNWIGTFPVWSVSTTAWKTQLIEFASKIGKSPHSSPWREVRASPIGPALRPIERPWLIAG